VPNRRPAAWQTILLGIACAGCGAFAALWYTSRSAEAPAKPTAEAPTKPTAKAPTKPTSVAEGQVSASAVALAHDLVRLRARIRSGMIKMDYDRSLGDVMGSAELYFRSTDAGAVPEFDSELREALMALAGLQLSWQTSDRNEKWANAVAKIAKDANEMYFASGRAGIVDASEVDWCTKEIKAGHYDSSAWNYLASMGQKAAFAVFDHHLGQMLAVKDRRQK
jgi:hypothetical protein